MYPPAGVSFRQCTADYKLSGLPDGAVLKKGTEVHVPVLAIHMDERYYPDPERFDPDRFTKEAVAARHPMAFLPFSQGPRICIGMRFALLEMKAAAARVLRDFTVVESAGTPQKIVFDPVALLTASKEPILVKVVPRK